MNSKGKDSDFDRDQMLAMLGGGISETLTRRPIGNQHLPSSSKSNKKDVSDLTTAETAAMLMDQNKNKEKKIAAGNVHRHRTHKVRNYHQLLQEEAAAQAHAELEIPQQRTTETIDVKDESDNEEFLSKSNKNKVAIQSQQRRGAASSSSSEYDSDSDHRPRRRRADSSSSSSDDDEAGQRRRRLLQKRLEKEQEQMSNEPAVSTEPILKRTTSTSSSEASTVVDPNNTKAISTPQPPSKKPASSSSSEGSSSDDDDSDSSSSDEDVAPALTKPVFVPRHKRSTVKQQEVEEQQEEEKEVELKKQTQKRKQESRAMVQQVIAASAQAAPDWNDAFEGITSARNAMPDDNDDNEDDNKARDEWEVRELVRLVEDWDLEQERLAEERELVRRRQMTDEERLKEDIKSGRYKRPGEQREAQKDGPVAKKYYHKGAFYMDEEEFDEGDVRRKADEYARAATASDKFDTRLLPSVMQVKKFGRANQSKYKGLNAEDTTDRQAETLPLKRKK